MGMPIQVCIHLPLQIVKRSALREAQCRIQSRHAVWGLVDPAVSPDLSLVAVKVFFPSWGSGILHSYPGVSFPARTRPTQLFALQDICRGGTKG